MKSLGILREEVLTFFCVNCWRKFRDGTSGLFVDFSCLVTIEIHLQHRKIQVKCLLGSTYGIYIRIYVEYR